MLENYNNSQIMEIIKWILLAILSGVIFVIFIKYLYNPIAAYIKSFFIVRQLLNSNNSTRNNLLGHHFADRLLDVWNNGNPAPLKSTSDSYSRPPYWQSRYTKRIIDNTLKEMELVDIYEQKGVQYVKLSDSILSKRVLRRLNKLIKKNRV